MNMSYKYCVCICSVSECQLFDAVSTVRTYCSNDIKTSLITPTAGNLHVKSV